METEKAHEYARGSVTVGEMRQCLEGLDDDMQFLAYDVESDGYWALIPADDVDGTIPRPVTPFVPDRMFNGTKPLVHIRIKRTATG